MKLFLFTLLISLHHLQVKITSILFLENNLYSLTFAEIVFRIGNADKEIIDKYIQCNTNIKANEFYSITKLDCPSENEDWNAYAQELGKTGNARIVFGKDSTGEYFDLYMYKLYKVSDEVGEYKNIKINGSGGSISVVSIIIIIAIICIILIIIAVVIVFYKKQSSAKLPRRQVTEKPNQTIPIQNTATTEQVASIPNPTPVTNQHNETASSQENVVNQVLSQSYNV